MSDKVDFWEDVFDALASKGEKAHQNMVKKIGDNCIGALVFYSNAVGALEYFSNKKMIPKEDFFKAESAFKRMADNDIVGDDLFTLWNNCCDLDTKGAVRVMLDGDIEDIKEHVKNRLKYSIEERTIKGPEVREGQWWSYYITEGQYKGKYVNIKGSFYEAKEKFKEKYGKTEATITPFDVMQHLLCDPDRFVSAPKCIEDID